MYNTNRITEINIKLKDIELRAVGASESLKSWYRRGYRLLLDEKARLQKTLENEDQLKI